MEDGKILKAKFVYECYNGKYIKGEDKDEFEK